MSFVTSVSSQGTGVTDKPEGEAWGLQPYKSSGRDVALGQPNPQGIQRPATRRALSDIEHPADEVVFRRGSRGQRPENSTT